VRQRLFLTLFLLTPVLMLGAVLLGIRYLRPEMNAPPVGAGAGSTGGANAIGEYLAHGTAKRRDVARADSEQPGSAGAPPAQPQAAPAALVAPESLPQGFVLVVTDQTKLGSASSPIYLAGNLNSWNPADLAWKLAPGSDGRWTIAVPHRADGRTMEFKFTRGSWELEELDGNLNVIANRTLPKVDASKLGPGERPTIELTVPHWGDERPERAAKKANDPYRHIEATGTLRRLQVVGGAGTAVGQTRDVLVWLPPGYDDPKNAGANYPVLYLHDGQNLFEKHEGIPAEWRADETATELIGKGVVRPLIIVGVPHSGTGRMSEYLPAPAIQGVVPEGETHIRWLMSEVMPRVERAFRVKNGPENTGVGGSSLGAAIALEAAAEHPEVFGLVLAESLPLRSGDAAAWDQWLAAIKTWPGRVYLGMGGQELGPGADKADRNRACVEAVQALDERLERAGLGPDRRLLVIDPSAVHNEEAWANRLPRALVFLFPP
jgi:enterochelin esterase-like enzyme